MSDEATEPRAQTAEERCGQGQPQSKEEKVRKSEAGGKPGPRRDGLRLLLASESKTQASEECTAKNKHRRIAVLNVWSEEAM